jgi:hypothetical protein
VGTRDLTGALESAIKRVEAIHEKYDNLGPMKSLDRPTKSFDLLVKPQNPVRILNQERCTSVNIPCAGRALTASGLVSCSVAWAVGAGKRLAAREIIAKPWGECGGFRRRAIALSSCDD